MVNVAIRQRFRPLTKDIQIYLQIIYNIIIQREKNFFDDDDDDKKLKKLKKNK